MLLKFPLKKYSEDMKAPIECQNCGRVYRADKLSNCPGCAAKSPKAIETSDLNEVAQSGNIYSNSPKTVTNAQRRAIQSAHIVDIYGTVLLWFGIIVGVIVFLCFIYLAQSLSDGAFIFYGLIAGLSWIITYVVLGSMIRMLSNYVIARLE